MKLACLLLFCVTILLMVPGCATTDPDNLAERPWNSQKGWEHGLPTSINEGR